MSDEGNTSKRDETIAPETLRKQTAWTFWGVVAIAVILVVVYPIWFWGFNDLPPADKDPEPWGQFGDFIGGILNPLVALFALYWLTRSIGIQREELAATKQELADTKLLIAEQVKTAEKQRFEDTFFALLDQHNAALRYLTEYVPNPNDLPLSNALCKRVFPRDDTGFNLRDANRVLRARGRDCGHYFRILYQLLKLIAMRCPGTTLKGEFVAENILESRPSTDEKLYSNIVRSFLDVEMTQLLAVNCYCQDDASAYWNYKCLIERYEFLEHMPFSVIGGSNDVLAGTVMHYRRRAFGNSEFYAALIRYRPELVPSETESV